MNAIKDFFWEYGVEAALWLMAACLIAWVAITITMAV